MFILIVGNSQFGKTTLLNYLVRNLPIKFDHVFDEIFNTEQLLALGANENVIVTTQTLRRIPSKFKRNATVIEMARLVQENTWSDYRNLADKLL